MCNLSEAIEVVKNALKEDRDINRFGYYEAWKEALVNCILDEFENETLLSSEELANNAAKNFLNTLINQ
jgi:imidazoleglycerol phosphate dehydratase HisB